jgi:hypothetical protein
MSGPWRSLIQYDSSPGNPGSQSRMGVRPIGIDEFWQDNECIEIFPSRGRVRGKDRVKESEVPSDVSFGKNGIEERQERHFDVYRAACASEIVKYITLSLSRQQDSQGRVLRISRLVGE